MMASLTTFFKKTQNAYLDKNRLKKIFIIPLAVIEGAIFVSVLNK